MPRITATPALSSRWRDLMNPDEVTRVRGSKATKSPTSMPSFRVSSLQLTFSSSRTCMVSALRSLVAVSAPWTWADALLSSKVPVYSLPEEVMTVQFSPSTLAQPRPPILVSLSMPLDLISLTMPPRVSTWALMMRWFSVSTPGTAATMAPLAVVE